MFLDLRTLGRGLWLMLFQRRFKLRRWFWVLATTWLFLGLWLFVAVGRLLDHLLFFRYRRQTVREPVFIIANPRSGTTFLHRLMALDRERFAYPKLYEAMFPAITHQKVIHGLAWLDAHTGRLLGRLVALFERKAFGGWKDVHQLGFSRAEEDEAYMIYTLLTGGIFLLFVDVDRMGEGVRFGDSLPPRKRRRVMGFYRSSLQRLLYLKGGHKTLLSKNVMFSGRLQSVRDRFPDARIIYLIRHPYEAIPSFVSMFTAPWRVHSPDIPKDSPEHRAMARLGVDYYKYAHRARDWFPDERFLSIRYDDLVADPRGTLERVYHHFGWPLTDELRERLNQATERSRRYKSAHQYTLDEYGLSADYLEGELGHVLDQHGFER